MRDARRRARRHPRARAASTGSSGADGAPAATRPGLRPRRAALRLLRAASIVGRRASRQFLADEVQRLGQKRFSLEGGRGARSRCSTRIVEDAATSGVEEMVIGMPHRGRLNVLAHILHKPYEMILSEFEGVFLPAGIQGDGDVKYHLGYCTTATPGVARCTSDLQPIRAISRPLTRLCSAPPGHASACVRIPTSAEAWCRFLSTVMPLSRGRGSWRRR